MAKVDPNGWLVTFSDLITLLLTFFVLLLSMSSMDRKVVSESMTLLGGDLGFASRKSAGRLPSKYEFVVELLQRPWEFRNHEERIRDLLFPDDLLPKEVSRSTLEETVKFLERPEGLAILLTEELLFPLGGHALEEPAKSILARLVPLILAAPNDVNVSGHADSLPGTTMDNDTLSALRGMAVLEWLLKLGVPDAKLSVSGYGQRMPVADNATPEGRALNRRVEILFKTSL
ncbi:MAG TPA: flagellar motor protein MotB [Desulfonatronum sp.]|nr:flagellar motor protein MotB [Desulfonatronum sp.]